MSSVRQQTPRGRGRTSPASWALLLALLGSACEREAVKPPPRIIDSPIALGESCTALPDTLTEIQNAQQDLNDLPDTRLRLDPACPRVTVLYDAGGRIPRAFRFRVEAGHVAVVRARAEFGGVVLGIDAPSEPRQDFSNVAGIRVDSVRVSDARDVVVRVTYAPRLRTDPRQSRVLVTVLAHP